MIVFDLKCERQGHVFEAWFGSSADYADQQARGLLTCPICGDAQVVKAVMAPAVAAKGNSRAVAVQDAPMPDAPVAISAGDAAKMRAMVDALAQA